MTSSLPALSVIGAPNRELGYWQGSNRGTGFRLPAFVSDPSCRNPASAGLQDGVLAILVDPTIPCDLVHVVCPEAFAPMLWDFSFMRGAEVHVLYRERQRTCAVAIYVELKKVAPRRIVFSCVRGGDERGQMQ